MSKSLKNFITIQQALQKQSACELRLVFLLHSWKDTLDYSDNTMEMATQYKKFLNVSFEFEALEMEFWKFNGKSCFQEFFLNVKDLTRHLQNEKYSKWFNVWSDASKELQSKFFEAKAAIHLALCDNIDTRTALDVVRDLVANCNIYIRDHATTEAFDGLLLRRIATYITDLLHIFGAIEGPRGGIGFPVDGGSNDVEETVMPYLTALAEFRDSIREMARSQKSVDILKICDTFRDDVLPNLGVRLEDRETASSSIKLVSRETLLKEREAKKLVEAQKAELKEKKRLEVAAAAAALEAQKKINPKEMFLHETDKYSAFDKKVC